MVNKLNIKIMPNHNSKHREYYEPKLNMVICGCGNRRLLTENEKLQHGLVASYNEIEMQILNQSDIPLRGQVPKRS